MAAIVRQPAASLVDCELTHLEAQPIDIAQARAEHAAYVALLERLGERVTVLPALEAFPDSCFVEDVLLALPELFKSCEANSLTTLNLWELRLLKKK